jgi:N-acetylglucosamine-6-sulfatase
MRKIGTVLASAALALGMLCFGSYVGPASSIRKAKAQSAPARPNIVFILTDDMRKDDLQYMPKTKALLQSTGMTFQNTFVSNALCCPSRATIMRGQYSHNTGVWSNSSTDSSSTTSGGWQAYQANHDEDDNVATRLQAAGYKTGLFGKYLNRYTDTTYIPPGWNRWFGAYTSGIYHYFNYYVNDQGTQKYYGSKSTDYSTDVISRKADTFISDNVHQGQPFFAYITPLAPHLPATPAPSHAHDFDGAKAPRLPSFNEQDVSDKPSWIRKRSSLTSDQIAKIDKRHEKRIESLQSVDDLVAGVINALSSDPNHPNALDDTYIFFTSDNGWHHGEHRIPSEKWRPYEEDIHMPLLVRGPGVAPGCAIGDIPCRTTDKLIVDTDYFSTFMDVACSSSPCDTQSWSYTPDGRSLRPVLEGNATSWRSSILLEAAAHFSPPYYGIRTSSEKYVEYANTAQTKELYDLNTDPYELTNIYNATTPPTGLASRLQALQTCKGDTCFTAENGP